VPSHLLPGRIHIEEPFDSDAFFIAGGNARIDLTPKEGKISDSPVHTLLR
jgi:hypothetical protein